MTRRHAAAAIFLILSTAGAEAAPSRSLLFTNSAPAASNAAAAGLRLAEAAASSGIEIDRELLAADPDQLEISLPGGATYLALRQVSWSEGPGRSFWSGQAHRDGVIETEPDGFVSISADGDAVAGSLQLEGRRFEILPLETGRQSLVELAPRGGSRERPSAACAATTGSTDEAAAEQPVLAEKGGKGDPPAPVTIEVLAMFPKSVTADPTGLLQLHSRINAWFDDANMVMVNSGVNARFRPLYSGPVPGAQPPVPAPGASAVTAGLSWLQANPVEVMSLRESLRADMVVLFMPSDDHLTCGAAPVFSTTAPYAVVDSGCFAGEYLVAHELGHILGMRHPVDEYLPTVVNPQPAYAVGYDKGNQLEIGGQLAATVMACNGDLGGAANGTPDGNQCNRIPYYSHATLQVSGVPIGSSTADNSRLARERAPTFAALRASLNTANLPPRITRFRPLGTHAQAGGWLTLEATAWDIEDGDLSDAVEWSSNLRGYLGTGDSLQVNMNVLGHETFTARVTDAGGSQFAQSTTLSVQQVVVTEASIWYDPRNPGSFLAHNQLASGQWIATWMTYEGNLPVWYQTGLGSGDGGGYWSAELARNTWDPATSEPTRTVIGTLSVRVETERQIRLWISGPNLPSSQRLLEPWALVSGPGAYWSLVGGNLDPGWVVFRGQPAFRPNGEEARLVIAFDGTQPVWTVGWGAGLGFPGSFFPVAMYRLAPGVTPDGIRFPGSHHVGSQAFFDAQQTGEVWLTFPSGQSWNRPSQQMIGVTVR